MKRWMGKHWINAPVAAIALTACVTINVYFPAAEAKEAAKEFVEKVIGDTPAAQPEAKPADGGKPGGSAYAQGAPDITIRTPAIQAIQARMESRFDSTLKAHFDSGALGFTNDGLVNVRDAAKIALKDRVRANEAVADQNRDAKAVYREVAVANGHPEWEAQIRAVFAKQWIESARSGWWYQDAGGGWAQK